jgi:hypothetical protein
MVAQTMTGGSASTRMRNGGTWAVINEGEELERAAVRLEPLLVWVSQVHNV